MFKRNYLLHFVTLVLCLVLCGGLYGCNGSGVEKGDKPTPSPQPVIPDGDYINRENEYAALKGWKFPILLVAEDQTVDDNGGQIPLLKKMDRMLNEVSKRFSVPGINDKGNNEVHFFITNYRHFSGDSSKEIVDATTRSEGRYALKLVVDSHASGSLDIAGWFPEYLSVGVDENLSSSKAINHLTKYLGSSRGVCDLSGGVVSDDMKNDINGASYFGPVCYMNNPEEADAWSDYAKLIINANGDELIAKTHQELMPENFSATVKRKDGEVASKAMLRFYPVSPGSGRVSSNPQFEGQLTLSGNFVFSRNPFAASVTNYLAEIQYDGSTSYQWMSIDKVESAALSTSERPFVYKIVLPDLDTDIPEGDYVNRKAGFAALPGWKYRVCIYGERQTVIANGGRLAFMKKCDKLMEDCSKYFQTEGINDAGGHEVHFYMTEFHIFEGLSKTLRYQRQTSEAYDLRIFIRATTDPADVGGGYLGPPYYNIGHNWSAGNGDLWTGYGVDACTHEMGHFRGIPDLYAEHVDADKNPINHTSFRSITDMMNSPYGIRVWSPYSKMILNANAGYGHIIKNNYDFMPKKVQVKAVLGNGSVADGAHINFYPVRAYSYSVQAEPQYQCDINAAAPVFTFDRNPFFIGSSTSDIYFNFLVETIYNGKKTYQWWPMHDIELSGGTIDANLYTLTIKL